MLHLEGVEGWHKLRHQQLVHILHTYNLEPYGYGEAGHRSFYTLGCCTVLAHLGIVPIGQCGGTKRIIGGDEPDGIVQCHLYWHIFCVSSEKVKTEMIHNSAF